MTESPDTPTLAPIEEPPLDPRDGGWWRDWIEDNDGNEVVANVGHIDGPRIVRAVNSHAKLVEALKAAEASIDAIKAAFGAPGDWGYEKREGLALFTLYKTRLLIRDALAQAEGRHTPEDKP